jgi:hypothetical protein
MFYTWRRANYPMFSQHVIARNEPKDRNNRHAPPQFPGFLYISASNPLSRFALHETSLELPDQYWY